MNSPADNSVTIMILDKEYRIGCPPEEQEALKRTAKYLDERMREIREGRRVIGSERIAVLAALNITHDLLELRDRRFEVDDEVGAQLQMMAEQIDKVMEDCTTGAN